MKKHFLFLFLFLQIVVYGQFKIPPIPEFQTSVYDYANILQEDEKKALENKLIKYSDTTGTQIVVITIETLQGEDIGILAPKWGHTWGIGGKKDDNGIVILLAKQERKIWISPGYGAEVHLVAGRTGEIVRNVIIPEFKAGSYYNGLNKGADAIFQVLQGKFKGKRTEKTEEGSVLPLLLFIGLLIVFIILAKNKNNNGGNSGGFGGPDLMDVIILSRMGRSGGMFGGGSFGGGGFGGSSGGGGFGGGFGGGGFSGGGAGGSW
jgi:uncharacterized protein